VRLTEPNHFAGTAYAGLIQSTLSRSGGSDTGAGGIRPICDWHTPLDAILAASPKAATQTPAMGYVGYAGLLSLICAKCQST